jgi:hypothetical protein
VYLYNALYVPNLTFLAILKALYPIGFHTCFWIFLALQDQAILSWATVLCLGIFLVGSLHFLLETSIKIMRMVYRVIKKWCKKGSKNQVTDSNKNKKGNK